MVNVGAVTELEEIEQRLNELTSQKNDLERSMEDLRGTIARLNRLSRQRFKDAFDRVNEMNTPHDGEAAHRSGQGACGRVRAIPESFSWIDRQLLHGGFLAALTTEESVPC